MHNCVRKKERIGFMHFIDVGFKQSGIGGNNNYYFNTIFYGLNDNLEEIDLYKLEEVYNKDVRISSDEQILNYLNEDEYNNLLKIINDRKMYHQDNLEYAFVEKIRSSKNIKKKELKIKNDK